METLAETLLDSADAEVRARDAGYWRRFPLAVLSTDARANRRRCHPSLGGTAHEGAAVVSEVESLWSSQLERAGGTGGGARDDDPLSLMMFDAVLDAVAASHGLARLRPGPIERPLEEILGQEYSLHATASGRRYWVRRDGTHPLVLINALGIPLALWAPFLGDPELSAKVIIPETRCGAVAEGGMASDAGLDTHAADVIEVMDAAGVETADVLAWCNGGRIAAAVTAQCPARVRSLTLLGTTLRGLPEPAGPRSGFEDNLQMVFSAIAKRPAIGETMVTMLRSKVGSQSWEGLASDSRRRAAALFARPPERHASSILTPMATAAFLNNYGRRTAADEAYPLAAALEALAAARVPVLLVTGDHDDIVSNDHIVAGLRRWGVRFVHATIKGAGHYPHALQYPYLRWVLESFLATREVPNALARVGVANVDLPEPASC